MGRQLAADEVASHDADLFKIGDPHPASPDRSALAKCFGERADRALARPRQEGQSSDIGPSRAWAPTDDHGPGDPCAGLVNQSERHWITDGEVPDSAHGQTGEREVLYDNPLLTLRTRPATGSLTFNQDGSGSVDVVLKYKAGSLGNFKGSTEHITGTWHC